MKNTAENQLLLKVPFVSVWDGGIRVETTAMVNTSTGNVINIGVANLQGLEVCEEQYIVLNDERVYVYENANGFDYWADLKGEWL